MAIPIFSIISSLWVPRSRPVKAGNNLILAGINQTVFLKQWGEPETQFCLKRLGSFPQLGPLFLIADPAEEVHHSVWIYKKRDRILFFTKKKLVLHYKWSEFKERCTRPNDELDPKSSGMPPSFMSTTLALVA